MLCTETSLSDQHFLSSWSKTPSGTQGLHKPSTLEARHASFSFLSVTQYIATDIFRKESKQQSPAPNLPLFVSEFRATKQLQFGAQSLVPTLAYKIYVLAEGYQKKKKWVEISSIINRLGYTSSIGQRLLACILRNSNHCLAIKIFQTSYSNFSSDPIFS